MAFRYILNRTVKLLNKTAKSCGSYFKKKIYKWYHAKLKAYTNTWSHKHLLSICYMPSILANSSRLWFSSCNNPLPRNTWAPLEDQRCKQPEMHSPTQWRTVPPKIPLVPLWKNTGSSQRGRLNKTNITYDIVPGTQFTYLIWLEDSSIYLYVRSYVRWQGIQRWKDKDAYLKKLRI